MRIGLTFDLQAEYLEKNYSWKRLQNWILPKQSKHWSAPCSHWLRYRSDRWIESLVGKLAAGEKWDMVFNISEGMHGLGREAQIPALLDAYCIPYTFS